MFCNDCGSPNPAAIAIILMLLAHKDGSSVCDAAHNEIAQQATSSPATASGTT
jgi:ATP-dependent Clp protease adapter protein ClpS